MSADPRRLAGAAAAMINQRWAPDGLDLAFVLGSGWANAADELGEPVGDCPLADLPGFTKPAVPGHGGQFRVVRTATGRTAAILTGRTHYYESRDVTAVAHGVRTVAAAGATTVVLTNGAGGLRSEWPPGTPVLISDHLNLTGASPLVGPTFVDLTEAYSPRLRDLARRVAPALPEGVYAQFPGPQYETPAEVRMAGVLGADLVGMSTALETIAAREAGLEVLGISLVTNPAAGTLTGATLAHDDVVRAGADAADALRALLVGLAGVL
ncbi:purine-nucleoside phosphorylase [Microlunatus sp. Y2014]|uniref:purine-nucleoside phosphorylase n=1 Tax=Microlunatus sp. Y2014 TaxID=3418488 RepID=UPI003DA725FA